jgi:glycosyltransferase involved in cell wall biosynthesis
VNSVPGHAAVDGIDTYSRTLAGALAELGATCGLLTQRNGTWRWCETPGTTESSRVSASDALRLLMSATAVVLQYNPFSWGKRGFAPGLLKLLGDVRRRVLRPKIILMLHERFTPWGGWRQTIMSGWQRAQLIGLSALVDKTLASTEPWAHDSASWRRRRIELLPVGSNLPDMRNAAGEMRQQLRLSSMTVVAVTLNTSHPSYSPEHIRRAVNRIADERPVTLLNLGAGAHEVGRVSAGVQVVAPGMLAPAELARLLCCGDLYMAPFVDGVSTRRTSLIAALQHGLPVVGTWGHSTGEILRPLQLHAFQDMGGFVDSALALAIDPYERTRHRGVSRRLYEENFSWSSIAARLLVHTGRPADPTK